MIKKYFAAARKRQLAEGAEIMPAAIITAIVSSILLLGITAVMSMVLQGKADQKEEVTLSTTASNIEMSLRADIIQATYINSSVKLIQPSTRLLSSTDATSTGLLLHVPTSTGECKVIKWHLDGDTITRNLTIHELSSNKEEIAKCDESSTVTAQRTKTFSGKFIHSSFKFHNHAGRELIFALSEESLTTVNTELERLLTEQGVEKLNGSDFNELKKLLKNDSLVVFADPDSCVMNAEKVTTTNEDGTQTASCPRAETDTVESAWESKEIARVGVIFDLLDSSGQKVRHDLEQNTSMSLR